MRIWTVHLPRSARSAARVPDAALPREPILVREGFSWGAFLFGPLWLLRHRLWLEAAAWIGLALLLAILVPAPWRLPVLLALQFLLGAEAQDLRRAALGRRGWRAAHVVAAPAEELALARLFEARPELLRSLAA
ncbi:DUF2628 domain-containing protein [Roseicella frigidaeris]|uniref:DUF2628 domain-containing protein n=1 Tax=Roseicella frigidaeris TaxID=2230885 RepID=A0A327M5E3_9PROT|nr:DUF2628 domain-containing protein [Roseicella frigidaeris]RAI57727.1 DUF2628 domain-containing protein [Roseicella frigidaeris]